jgi:hypothetical protein
LFITLMHYYFFIKLVCLCMIVGWIYVFCHISAKNGKKKNKKHKLRSTICMHCTGMSCSLDPMFVLNCLTALKMFPFYCD